MKILTKKIKISGVVQGVCYRAYTNKYAKHLSVGGTIRNMPDGSVEVIFQGEPKILEDFLVFLKQGSPNSNVRAVSVEDYITDKIYSDFKIIY